MVQNFGAFLLLLTAILSTSAVPDSDLCKSETEFNIYRRHPTDCTRFYTCQSQVHPIILSCPTGLYYDELFGFCDYPSNVDCSTAQPSEPESTDDSEETTESIVSTTEELIETTSESKSSTITSKSTLSSTEVTESSTEASTSTELTTGTESSTSEVHLTETTEQPSTSPTTVSSTPKSEDSGVIYLRQEEIDAKYFHLRYTCVYDRYDRLLLKPDGSEEVIKTYDNWQSLSYYYTRIRRVIENDWNTVYLARESSFYPALITWYFDFSLIIKDIELTFWTSIFYGAEVRLYFVDINGTEYDDVKSLVGKSSWVGIIAKLDGGQGVAAWQHAQLFRQFLGTEDFPFELKISFE